MSSRISHFSWRWELLLAAHREMVARGRQAVLPLQLAVLDQTPEEPRGQAALAGLQAPSPIRAAPRHRAALAEVW